MKITRNIEDYIISKSSSINEALKKLEESGLQILFLVDSKKRLSGVATDGDIRRWLLKQEKPDLSLEISNASQSTYVSILKGTGEHKLPNLFSRGIRYIPILDANGLICEVATDQYFPISIGDKKIGKDQSVYIIGEIGNNHQGNLKQAKLLIEMASEAGVDSAKFQMRSMNRLYEEENSFKKNSSKDLGAEYTLDLLDRFQLSDDDLFRAFDHCKKFNIEPLCTPWDEESLEKLSSYGLTAFKVASADFTNHDLLRKVAQKKLPMFCSTGMSTEIEIDESVSLLRHLGSECILLHCNSTYPSPYRDINLNYFRRLLKYGFDVGYSGHERGIFVPIAAVALGACVIEKHITFDKELEGNDHKVSLLPDELSQMVRNIRSLEESMGKSGPRDLSQGEMINREVLAKSLYAKVDIEQGEKILRKDIGIKSPGQGLQPNKLDDLVGKTSYRKVQKGTFFFNSDIAQKLEKKEKYIFSRPYGIPIRYHDYQNLALGTNLDFVEFHLSYKDLEISPADYIKSKPEFYFSVHAPELFKGDHILDLCSLDSEYREISLDNMKMVIEHVKELRNQFNPQKDPILVINAGGWNRDGFISKEQKTQKYRILKESLSNLDLESISLAIQTMPPFPWHFGGQSFHNLFVDPKEINDFCSETGLKVCLDISHSMMACNYYGWDLKGFIETIKDDISYLHIVDCKGFDGEGIQIGEGDVNFEELSKTLNKNCPQVPFIPEIWQGHKDSGEGFWKALDFLELYF